MTASNEMLDAALAYATEKNWPIFPCKPSEKVPLTKNGVLDATTDERQITKWWTATPDANIGFDAGGASFMILDLDSGHNIEELEKNVGKIPHTNLACRTPRGGEHRYFALDDGELVSPSSSKLAPHVDIRSFHSYVLLPPSRTKDGSYIWEIDRKPAYRTDEMVRVANSAREKHEDRDKWIIPADRRENIQTATKWLQQDARPAVEGAGGDHCTYATAAYLKSLAISEELTLELMWEHWWPRCDPPWLSEEGHDYLRQKVSNAYQYNTSPPGNLTPGYRVALAKQSFKPVISDLPSGDERRIPGFRFVDREGMDHIRPPRWIVTDLLADESFMILFGPYSSFKTFIALDLALSIAAGQTTDPTWEIAQSGPVLFAAGEGRSSLLNRVRGWEKMHFGGFKVPDFVLVDPVPTTAITEESILAFTEEALRRHPNGYRLSVMDTLGKAMAGADENSQKDASAMTQLAHRLRTDLGGSLLALHHVGLQEQKRLRGSSVFAADADTLVRVARRGRDYEVELRMAKQKDAPEWEDEKRLKLVKVRLALEQSTLAAMPASAPTPEERKVARATSRQREEVVLGVIDEEVGAILEANPLKTWTQRDLAEAVAMRELVTIDSKTLANIYLIRVRERKGTLCNRAYDPQRNPRTGRWRCPG